MVLASMQVIRLSIIKMVVLLPVCQLSMRKNQPLNVFCPGTVIPTLQDCTFGDELQLVFAVNQFNNNLNLRCLEVLRCVR